MSSTSSSLTSALLRETSRLSRDIEGTRRFYMRWLVAGVLSTVCLVTGIVFQIKPAIPPQGLIIFVSLFISVIIAQVLNALYRRAGKAMFVEGMAGTAGLTYDENGVFGIGEVKKHKIIPAHNKAEVEDGFSGTVHGVAVAFQEVRLSDIQQVKGHESGRRDFTAFWGMIIRIRLHKRMEGHTIVVPRAGLQALFRGRLDGFEPVRVAAKFEKSYAVMGTDQVEARVVLDPAFMERFLEAAQIMRARWMEVSFLDNEILFAVQRFRPLFEVGHLWQPVTPDYLRKLADHIDAVDRMIEALKLNRHVAL